MSKALPPKPLSTYAQGAGLFRKCLLGNIQLNLLRDNFEISTWLAMGATLQLFLLLISPLYLAISPAILTLTLKLVYSLLVIYRILPNHRTTKNKSILIRSLPAGYTDSSGSKVTPSSLPGNGNLCLVMIAAQSHHPFGHLAPSYDFSSLTDKMIKNLETNAETNGFLGATSFLGTSQWTSGNTIMDLLYFRSKEDVDRFHKTRSHSEAHIWTNGQRRKGNDWYGLYQENYEVSTGGWDNFSARMVPTMIGEYFLLCVDDEVENQFKCRCYDVPG